jgi:hypothetical protein
MSEDPKKQHSDFVALLFVAMVCFTIVAIVYMLTHT